MKIFKCLILVSIFALTACKNLQKKNEEGYHWEIDAEKMEQVDKNAKWGISSVRTVWVNPPRKKVPDESKE